MTLKELDVLRLIVAGRRNNEIAILLSLSQNTVESHTRRLYRKLGVRSRPQAIMRAQTQGLLTGASSQKASSRRRQAKTAQDILDDFADNAMRQVVNSLSLVMVYSEFILHHANIPQQLRESLANMVSGAQTLAWDLQAAGEWTTHTAPARLPPG